MPVPSRLVTRQVLRPGQVVVDDGGPPPPGWRLRRAVPAQAGELAALHLAAMPDDLLPRLGLSLLCRHFWPRLIASPQGDTWVLHDDQGRLAGFCVMARHRLPFRLSFYTDVGFCAAMLVRLLRHPRALLQSLGMLAAPLRLQRAIDEVPAELVLLAVREDCRGQGAGRLLLRHALRELGPRACLVRTASEDARRFYQRAGFVMCGRELRNSRSLHLLVRRWSPLSSA